VKTTKPNLYHYANYRTYLSEFYAWNKRQDPSYSLRYFAAQAGLKSYNYLKLIIDGDRRMTETFLDPFCQALKLNDGEQKYFRTLVKYTDAKTSAEKSERFNELMKMRENSELHTYDFGKDGILDHWYYIPLIELTETNGFVYDPAWIAKRIGVSTSDIRGAISRLIRANILCEKGGTLVKSHALGNSTDEILDLKIQHYHHENLKIAANAVFELPLAEREYGSMTFSVSEEKLKKLKAKMKSFRQEVFAVLDEPDAKGDNVYHLGLQLFRMSKKEDEAC